MKYLLLSLALPLGGCYDFYPNLEKDPAKLIWVVLQADRCCLGNCTGIYATVPQTVACTDRTDMVLCLEGHHNHCPVKGQGAF